MLKDNVKDIFKIDYIIIEYLSYTITFDMFPSIELKGMHLNHNFYVVVDKPWRTENAYTGHQHNIFI